MARRVALIALLFALLFAAYAEVAVEEDIIHYGIFVNGEEFTSAHKEIQCGGGYATYHPSNHTLTLKDATITKASINLPDETLMPSVSFTDTVQTFPEELLLPFESTFPTEPLNNSGETADDAQFEEFYSSKAKDGKVQACILNTSGYSLRLVLNGKNAITAPASEPAQTVNAAIASTDSGTMITVLGEGTLVAKCSSGKSDEVAAVYGNGNFIVDSGTLNLQGKKHGLMLARGDFIFNSGTIDVSSDPNTDSAALGLSNGTVVIDEAGQAYVGDDSASTKWDGRSQLANTFQYLTATSVPSTGDITSPGLYAVVFLAGLAGLMLLIRMAMPRKHKRLSQDD